MNNEKIITLLKKIKALADKGVGGEKETANERLAHLMKKHGISMDDISDDVRKRFRIRLKKTQWRFFNQVVGNVAGTGNYKIFDERKYPTGFYDKYIVECTDAHWIEIMAKFEFFWKKYEEDLDIFYSAFIQRNRLYVENTSNEERELTQDELDKIMKVMQMSRGLAGHQFQKRLTQ